MAAKNSNNPLLDKELPPLPTLVLPIILEERAPKRKFTPHDMAATSQEHYEAESSRKGKETSGPADAPEENGVELALRVIKTGDFGTAIVLQKACSDRIEELQLHSAKRFFDSRKTDDEVKSAGSFVGPDHAREVQTSFARRSSPSSSTQGQTQLGSLEFHPSNPFRNRIVSENNLSSIRIPAPSSNNVSILASSNLNASTSALTNTKPSFNGHLAEIQSDNDAHRIGTKGQSQKGTILYKDRARYDEQTSQMTTGGGGSVSHRASGQFGRGIASFKGLVKEKAFSSPRTKRNMPGAFDEHDTMLFGPPNSSPKRLQLVREVSVMGSPTWVSKKKEEEKGEEESASDAETDSGAHSSADSSTGLQPAPRQDRQSLTSPSAPQLTLQPFTPGPGDQLPDAFFPPRLSSMRNPLSFEHNFRSALANDSDRQSDRGEEDKSCTLVGDTTLIGVAVEMGAGEHRKHRTHRNFQRIDHSHRMQDPRRVNSESALRIRAGLDMSSVPSEASDTDSDADGDAAGDAAGAVAGAQQSLPIPRGRRSRRSAMVSMLKRATKTILRKNN